MQIQKSFDQNIVEELLLFLIYPLAILIYGYYKTKAVIRRKLLLFILLFTSTIILFVSGGFLLRAYPEVPWFVGQGLFAFVFMIIRGIEEYAYYNHEEY